MSFDMSIKNVNGQNKVRTNIVRAENYGVSKEARISKFGRLFYAKALDYIQYLANKNNTPYKHLTFYASTRQESSWKEIFGLTAYKRDMEEEVLTGSDHQIFSRYYYPVS